MIKASSAGSRAGFDRSIVGVVRGKKRARRDPLIQDCRQHIHIPTGFQYNALTWARRLKLRLMFVTAVGPNSLQDDSLAINQWYFHDLIINYCTYV